jgi:hypothetical protein
MSDRGLDTSIWAARGNGNTGSFTRPGDWNCPSCGFSNFQRRTECMRCSSSRAGTPRSNTPAVTTIQQNIIPPQIEHVGGLEGQYGVSSNPAVSMMRAPPQDQRLEKGLADSFWAPRNQGAGAKKADGHQIWTKVGPWIPIQIWNTSNSMVRRNIPKTTPQRTYNHTRTTPALPPCL